MKPATKPPLITQERVFEERTLRAFLEFAPDAIVVIDTAGAIVLVNAQTEKLFGYSREELIGRPVETLVPERLHRLHPKHRKRYTADPQVRPMGAGLHLSGRRKDGSEFSVEISLAPLRVEEGTLIFAAVRDITDRHHAEEAKAHLAAIVEYSDDAIIGKTLEGVITSWNRGAERLYGYEASEVLGQPIAILAPPNRHDEVPALLQRVRLGEQVDHYETVRARKDGTLIDVSVAISPIRDGSGAVVGASVVARDITKMRRSQEKFQSFVEFAPDAIVIIDPGGHITLVNGRTEKMFGYRRDELLGLPVEHLLPERFRVAHQGHRTHFLADPRARQMGAGLDLYGLRKDGNEFPVDISLSPLETEEGLLLAAAIRDVTERKRLESMRDTFISNAAHELRTPMATLSMLAATLSDRMQDMTEEQVAEALGALRRQGERASALVSNLLDLSQLEGGRAHVTLGSVNLLRSVRAAIESTPPPDGVALSVKGAESVAAVADPVRLGQILTNLLSNAYRYGGRTITIEASTHESEAILCVSDDGAGVPANLIQTLFDPFVRGTTAGAVGGSGIGLAVCRLLVEAFGGQIWYETAPPHGARFVIRLKVA